MRMGKLCLLLIIGLLAGFTQTEYRSAGELFVSRFFCWHCDTLEYDNCGENFETSGLPTIDCSKMSPPKHLVNVYGAKYSKLNATGCVKTVSTKGTRTIIRRSCFFGNPDKLDLTCLPDEYESIQKYDVCDVCTEHLCNRSSSMISLHAFVVVAVVFIFVL
ncbi:uncharacterized protein LOC129608310 isoform X2 [Condylostylus longicornis]|uniref:uncharacterized protein LOC129608310 isoform X2 n=1 Tax=Condylostylus longicornis TaxID=2530218 RepID=UPI00244E2FBD|nr:uncharacterized protein LOC129608310 isoform X2 [Condylostylus longicornis]XP_055375728.1 uncharacterized protein LOC129608310 isoform X2 [Condylostylus longicornis]